MTTTAPSAIPEPTASKKPRATLFRPEIQGLRALAVGLVVVYHLWPHTLTGGYVGVDVFFVISGFLITAHLLREAESTGTIKVGQFWARRMRRLLPASLTVLGAVCLFLIMTFQWSTFFTEVLASTFYVENWAMAYKGVDYLAGTTSTSPVRHFWSLSVEEQFYFVWPLLFIAVLAISRLAKKVVRPARALLILMIVVLVASFAYSVYASIAQPNIAYYVTPTRAWEFAIGGLLALIGTATIKAVPRAVVGWAGLAAIAVSALVFDETTPFPGSAALLPTLGTAAVIWAGNTGTTFSFDRISRFRPVRWLGDVSYAVYLWHWPFIVFAAIYGVLNPGTSVAIIVITLILAALTKRFIEDPTRSLRFLKKPRMVFIAAAIAMAAVAVPAGTANVLVDRHAKESVQQATAMSTQSDACFGVLTKTVAGACSPAETTNADPLPSPQAASLDDLNTGACWGGLTEAQPKRCDYGDPETATLKIAVVGDSHAAAMLGALQVAVEKNNWYVQTYLKGMCGYSDGITPGNNPVSVPSCVAWKKSVEEQVKSSDVDAVLAISYSGELTSAEQSNTQAEGYASAWKRLIDAGIPVLTVADNPNWDLNPNLCLVAHDDAQRCTVPLADAYRYPDPKVLASEKLPAVHLVEMRDLYCPNGACSPIIGGVTVYRDTGHLTATFSRSLGTELAQRVESALGR